MARSGRRAAHLGAAVLAVVTTLAGCATAAPAPAGSPRDCGPGVTLSGGRDVVDRTAVPGVAGAVAALVPDADGRLLVLYDGSSLASLGSGTVTRLADESGRPLDAEGLAVEPDGTRLVLSETEPSVRAYDRAGRLLGRLPLRPDLLAGSGRAGDGRTLESLARSADGATLLAAEEGPLSGDDPAVRRVLTWQRDPAAGGAAGAPPPYRPGPQYALAIDPDRDVWEITGVGDGRLLVLERGAEDGGYGVRLLVADPRAARDVAGVPALGADAPGLATVRMLADLGTCASPRDGRPLRDAVGGALVTGRTPDGRLSVLLAADETGPSGPVTRLYDATVALPPS